VKDSQKQRQALVLANPVTLAPITPSEEDVINIPPEGCSKDVSVDAITGIEQSEVQSKENVLKKLIPLKPKLHWPNWSLDYLKAVIACRTDGAAARKIGLSYQTVYEARLSSADFATAWDACRNYRNSKIVNDLEDKSLARALECDPKDRMSASLNMFHLKARDDRYKDKAAALIGGITINLGYAITDTKRKVGPVIDADFE